MKSKINKKGPKEKVISNTTKNAKSASRSFPIAGIGASAGGLEALEQFFIEYAKR